MEDNQAFVRLVVHLQELLEGDCEQDAGHGNGNDVKRCVLYIIAVEVRLEGKGHGGHRNAYSQVHDRVFDAKADDLDQIEEAEDEERYEAPHHAVSVI